MSRLESLLDALQRFYGAVPSLPRDPFALFVREVLSVQAAPHRRDAAFASLKRVPALTPDAMWKAPPKKLEESVRLAGPYTERRLAALRTGVEFFRRRPDLASRIRGPLLSARRALNGLPRMGDDGAHRMLLFAADHAVLPAEGRMGRVILRLGFGKKEATPSRTARSIRDDVARDVPPGTPDAVAVYRRAFLYLDHHAVSTCTESEPHCHVCPVRDECPSSATRRGGGAS